MKKVLILHGPNLDLLGEREKKIYGSQSLYELEKQLHRKAKELGIFLVTFQSNSEEKLIKAIHAAKGKFDYIIFNPAAFTHTSIAIRDALLAVGIPVIEVHLSNVFSREEFRRKSFISDIARGVISGFGPFSYILALEFIAHEEEGL